MEQNSVREIIKLSCIFSFIFSIFCNTSIYALDYHASGNAKFASGDMQGAVADYSQIIEGNPNDVVALINRGSANLKLKNYQAALQDYSTAIEIDEKLSLAYKYRGNLYSELKSYEQAIKDYSQAIKLSFEKADLLELYQLKINTEIIDNKYEAAALDYDQLVALDPVNVRAYNKKKQQVLEAQSNKAMSTNVMLFNTTNTAIKVVVAVDNIIEQQNDKNKANTQIAQAGIDAAKKKAEEDAKKAAQNQQQSANNKPVPPPSLPTPPDLVKQTGTIVFQNLSSNSIYGRIYGKSYYAISSQQSMSVPVSDGARSYTVYFYSADDTTNPISACTQSVYVGVGQTVTVSCGGETNATNNGANNTIVSNNNTGSYNNNSATNTTQVANKPASPKYVAGGIYDHCMEKYKKKANGDEYIKNNCGEQIFVTYMGFNGKHHGAFRLEPGEEDFISLSGSEDANRYAGGGHTTTFCPAKTSPVDANDKPWSDTNDPNAQYRCKYWGR